MGAGCLEYSPERRELIFILDVLFIPAEMTADGATQNPMLA